MCAHAFARHALLVPRRPCAAVPDLAFFFMLLEGHIVLYTSRADDVVQYVELCARGVRVEEGAPHDAHGRDDVVGLLAEDALAAEAVDAHACRYCTTAASIVAPPAANANGMMRRPS